MMHLLPELLDGVGKVVRVDTRQVANLTESLIDCFVEALVPTLQAAAIVGRYAGFRVPVVATRAPRQLWRNMELKNMTQQDGKKRAHERSGGVGG